MTPDAVEPIAKLLRRYHPDDEDFANAVTSIILQILHRNVSRTYEYTLYPVEVFRDAGVCDEHAVLAASIMIAGKLDVVLLYYEAERHVNVGYICQGRQLKRGGWSPATSMMGRSTTWPRPQEV